MSGLARWVVFGLVALGVGTATFLWLRTGESAPSAPDRLPGLDVQLRSWRCGHESVVTASETIPAEGDFCYAALDIENTGEAPRRLEPSCQFLIDDAAERHTVRADIMELDPAAKAGFGRRIAPGVVVEDTALYYDVPKGTSPVALELRSSCDEPGLRLPLAPELEGAE